jgi:chemotaxis family two-component system response regulator PixG
MSTEITAGSKIAHDLISLHQRRATGKLIITQDHHLVSQWQLYFYLGRLVLATGGKHPARRWYRALRRCCPEEYKSGSLKDIKPVSTPWEGDVLNQAMQQHLMTHSQVKNFVQSLIRETVFGFIEQKNLETNWQASQPIAQRTALLSVEQIIQDAQQLREEWRAVGLGHLQELIPQFSPDLAPIIKHSTQFEEQLPPQVCAKLKGLMKGQHTLWDIALKLNCSLSAIMRSLLPLIHRGIIGLEEIPDLPSPFVVSKTHPIHSQPKQLIACIDDSPITGQILKMILKPFGYEVLSIEDPLQSITTLLKCKPDLIFLDLIMPNTNGYELCTLLRKSSAFQDKPIVILTGHDGVIDRVRAKMVGSSDFLSKPPDPDKVIQVVQKHLRASLSDSDSLSMDVSTASRFA